MKKRRDCENVLYITFLNSSEKRALEVFFFCYSNFKFEMSKTQNKKKEKMYRIKKNSKMRTENNNINTIINKLN